MTTTTKMFLDEDRQARIIDAAQELIRRRLTASLGDVRLALVALVGEADAERLAEQQGMDYTEALRVAALERATHEDAESVKA